MESRGCELSSLFVIIPSVVPAIQLNPNYTVTHIKTFLTPCLVFGHCWLFKSISKKRNAGSGPKSC